MFLRQVGIGASAVLAVGLLAAGCSEDGDTIILGSNILNNSDSFNASSISSNNTAPDGGAFSIDKANVQGYKIHFNSGTSAADGSAIILVTVKDATDWHLFAAHYQSGSLTPLVELDGDDRDDVMPLDVNAMVAVPLNTANWAEGSDATEQSGVRANSGNWLIVWSYHTLFRHPSLDVTQDTTGLEGAHRVVALSRFVKSLRDTPMTTSDKFNDGDTRVVRHGFDEEATVISATLKGGFIDDGATRDTASSSNPKSVESGSMIPVPAEHVLSYGVATDTFRGEAAFGGKALPFYADGVTDGLLANPGGVFTSVDLDDANATKFEFAYPNIGNDFARDPADLAAFTPAIFQNGDATTFIHFFFTQVASSIGGGKSHSSGATSTRGMDSNRTAGDAAMHQGGHYVQLRSASFDLFTGAVGTDAQVSVGGRHGTASDHLRAGTAVFPEMRVYNGHVFFKYADASLSVTDSDDTTHDIANPFLIACAPGEASFPAWTQDNTGGHNGGNIDTGAMKGFWEEIIAQVKAGTTTSDEGLSSIGSTIDVSPSADTYSSSTTHAHTTDNPTFNTTSTDQNKGTTYPDREMANFNGGRLDGELPRSIFGPDEGLGDVTLFYLMADNTNDQGSKTTDSIDRELYVVVLATDGTFSSLPATVTGNNPAQVSDGERDWHGQGGNAAGTDPLYDGAGGTGRPNKSGAAGTAGVLKDPIVPNGGVNGEYCAGYNAGGAADYPSPEYFSAVMNRTGHYVALAWLQDVGTSAPTGSGTGDLYGSFHQSLHVRAYQPYRTQYWSSTNQTVQSQVGPAARLSTATLVDTGALTGTDFGDGGQVSTGISSGSASVSTRYAPDGRHNDYTATGSSLPDLGYALDDAEEVNNWDRLPTNSYKWQEKVGYGCGLQSDWRKLSILFEASDATEDRLFVSQFTISPSSTGTPTLTAGSTYEVQATPSVSGNLNHNLRPSYDDGRQPNKRSTYRMLDGSAQDDEGEIRGWLIDAGVDDVAVASSGPNGGDVLLVYQMVNDGTNADGDGTDLALLTRRVTYSDGASGLGAAFHIGRGIDSEVDLPTESAQTGGALDDGMAYNVNYSRGTNGEYFDGVAGAFKARWPGHGWGTGFVGVDYTPKSADLVGSPSYPNASANVDIYVFMADRTGQRVVANATSTSSTASWTGSSGLYVRTFHTGSTLNAQNAYVFEENWYPVATDGGVVSSGEVTGLGFKDPIRLDHEVGVTSDITSANTATNGSGILVLFEQNGHLWAQGSSSAGKTWLQVGGAPNPALVDNDNPQNIETWTPKFSYDSNCNATDGIILFTKQDYSNGDVRAHVRHSVRVN